MMNLQMISLMTTKTNNPIENLKLLESLLEKYKISMEEYLDYELTKTYFINNNKSKGIH